MDVITCYKVIRIILLLPLLLLLLQLLPLFLLLQLLVPSTISTTTTVVGTTLAVDELKETVGRAVRAVRGTPSCLHDVRRDI